MSWDRFILYHVENVMNISMRCRIVNIPPTCELAYSRSPRRKCGIGREGLKQSQTQHQLERDWSSPKTQHQLEQYSKALIPSRKGLNYHLKVKGPCKGESYHILPSFFYKLSTLTFWLSIVINFDHILLLKCNDKIFNKII